MLNITKKSIVLTGNSAINGTIIEGYSATIDTQNPESMTVSAWPIKKDAYKVNRVQCRADKAEFEEMAYALQEELIAQQAAEKTEE